MRTPEPVHVSDSFSGVRDSVAENGGRASHRVLRGAGDLFSVLHLRFPPVLPPCVAASGGEYVYAAQRGIYHSDTAVL